MRAANKFKIRPRLVVAILLAPLAPGLLAIITSALHNPYEGVWVLKMSAMLTYPAMIVVGAPLHLLFIKKGWTKGWLYTLAGFVIGALVAEAVFGWFVWNPGILFLGAMFGALIAFTFWLIARPESSPG